MEAELTAGTKLSPAIERTISAIPAVDDEWLRRAQRHLDSLTKPLGSLGQIEAVAAQYVAWRQEQPPRVAKKAVYVFAADHGITDEGVSAYPQGGHAADGAQLPERRSSDQCAGPAYQL